MSNCHQSISVVRRTSSTICLNDIFSETTSPARALIFGMKLCLVDLYQVYLNGGLGFKMALREGLGRGLGFENKI